MDFLYYCSLIYYPLILYSLFFNFLIFYFLFFIFYFLFFIFYFLFFIFYFLFFIFYFLFFYNVYQNSKIIVKNDFIC